MTNGMVPIPARLAPRAIFLPRVARSTLLAGMGPVQAINTTAGKLCDSFCALFCAVILLGASGVLFTPLIHRILHRFHLEDAGAGR